MILPKHQRKYLSLFYLCGQAQSSKRLRNLTVAEGKVIWIWNRICHEAPSLSWYRWLANVLLSLFHACCCWPFHFFLKIALLFYPSKLGDSSSANDRREGEPHFSIFGLRQQMPLIPIFTIPDSPCLPLEQDKLIPHTPCPIMGKALCPKAHIGPELIVYSPGLSVMPCIRESSYDNRVWLLRPTVMNKIRDWFGRFLYSHNTSQSHG